MMTKVEDMKKKKVDYSVYKKKKKKNGGYGLLISLESRTKRKSLEQCNEANIEMREKKRRRLFTLTRFSSRRDNSYGLLVPAIVANYQVDCAGMKKRAVAEISLSGRGLFFLCVHIAK